VGVNGHAEVVLQKGSGKLRKKRERGMVFAKGADTGANRGEGITPPKK